MDTHDKLVKKALDAMSAVFNDTTVDQDETRSSLQAIRDEIDVKLETLTE